MNPITITRASRLALLFTAGLVSAPGSASGQDIVFEGDLPRTMVFIQEEGRGKVAAREMTSFLLEAGFPVIDPALAIDESAQALVMAAMNGDDGDATQLGRDWGAQVLVLGVADYATRDNPGPGDLITATTEVAVRALRLDFGEVVSDAATGFPMWDVKTALRRQIAAERVLVIADACHSAGAADGDVVGGSSSNQIAGGFQGLFTPSRRLMMTAADTNEFSLEDERWGGHGVFTHFLLDGLRGAGDLDSNGIVTFTELFDQVSNNVRQATSGRQNPQRSGFGDIPLAVVGGGGPQDR